MLKSSDNSNILINTSDSAANNSQLIGALKMNNQTKQKGGVGSKGAKAMAAKHVQQQQ